jgi:hypothetical protein
MMQLQVVQRRIIAINLVVQWRSLMKKLLWLPLTLFIGALLIWLVSATFVKLNHLKKTEELLDKQAEVSPGVWIKYQEYRTDWKLENGSWGAVHGMKSEERKFWQTDSRWMSIPWRDQDVTWLGVGVPICLRAWKDELYLVVFDRDTIPVNSARFRFYRQTHGVLAEISAKEFPREIATQNLWLSTENGFRDGRPINQVEIAKALDPASIDFRESLTAKIWLQCEMGKEYNSSENVEKAFLESYLKKYAVVRLLGKEKG